MNRYGTSASAGIAIGPIQVYRAQAMVPSRTIGTDVTTEVRRVHDALRMANDELHSMSQLAKDSHKDLLGVQLAMVGDPVVTDNVVALIQEGCNAEEAYYDVVESHIRTLAEHPTPAIKERIIDFIDVRNRVLRHLKGIMLTKSKHQQEKVILLADTIYPSDLIALGDDAISGLATVVGNPTSHVTILAKSLGIPYVYGVEDLLSNVGDGTTMILDGTQGVLTFDPTLEELTAATTAMQTWNETINNDNSQSGVTRTKDGHRIILAANIANLDDLERAKSVGAEGIGLFRTEFMFLGGRELPTEEEQYQIYSKVVSAFPDHPVVIRTLDVGGDKELPGLTIREENPYLGNRGIRLFLQHKDIACTQIRALLRAAKHGRLHVLLPMVTTLAEVLRVKQWMVECDAQLQNDGCQTGPITLGIMIETPASAILSDQLAKHVDFFSIGTNDLTQYVMASSRTSETVQHLYQPYHPAVLRMIRMIVEAAEQEGIWVGVCGEMASDSIGSRLLIGLGVDELSMVPPAITVIRQNVTTIDYVNTNIMAINSLQKQSHDEVIAVCETVGKEKI